jgi:hypothetical protein
MTNMDVNALFDEVLRKYQEIAGISDWHALQTARNLDQINVILDRRAVLLKEIQGLDETLRATGVSGLSEYRLRYEEIRKIVREVQDSDKGLNAKITQRMNEIKEELKAKTLFRTRALPGYIKQKYAFSR